MLFLTNLTAIVLSSAFIFLAVGFHPRQNFAGRETGVIRYRLVIATVVLVALAVPLFRTLQIAAYQANVKSKISKSLTQILQHNDHARPDSVRTSFEGDVPHVNAVVATRRYIGPEEIEKMQANLSGQVGRAVLLDVQQVQLATKPEPPKNDYVSGGVIKPVNTVEDPAAQVSRIQTNIRDRLCTLFGSKVEQHCEVTSVGSSQVVSIEAELSRDKPLPLEALQIAANSLQSFLEHPVRLHARVSLRNTITPLTIGKRSADMVRSLREAIPKLEPLLKDPSIRVRLSVPDGMVLKQINAIKDQIARALRLDSAFVEVHEGAGTASIELMQDLQSESDPEQPVVDSGSQ